jgi:hypothetical protein
MERELFDGKFGVLIAALAAVVFFGAFYFSLGVRNFIWTIFFFVYAGVYFWDYRRTGKMRDLISAVVFLLAGITAVVMLFGLGISWQMLWISTIVLYVLSGPIAALLRGIFGKKVDLNN